MPNFIAALQLDDSGDADAADDVWIAVRRAVEDALAWLDAHPAHPCYADLWAAQRRSLELTAEAADRFDRGDHPGGTAALGEAKAAFNEVFPLFDAAAAACQ